MMTPLTAGMGRQAGGYRRPLGWFYYAKKHLVLFPGVFRARSAPFLADFYAQLGASRSVPKKLSDALAYTLFQAWVPLRARQVAKRYRLGRGWARQAVAICRDRFADPQDLAFFRITDAAQLDGHIRRFEHSVVSKRINPRCWEPTCVLANKIEFYARCLASGLPHPQVHATRLDGIWRIHALPQAGKLVVKPAGGEGGRGFRLEDYAPAGAADEAAFAAFLDRLPKRGLWVVQERVSPHPDTAHIALSALPTARVTTILDEAGTPEIVTSVLRFAARPASLVDNIKAGGLMAPIDPDTGVLGLDCDGRGVRDFARHPANGAAIEGLRLPHWDAVVPLVLDAHARVFGEYVLVGWDVALTPHGPLLIEGNGKPSMVVAQRGMRSGIGETRYGDLLRHHLAAC